MGKAANILLIYTGGTIGMIKNKATGSLQAFNFDNLLQHIPELDALDCAIKTVSLETPIDSSAMNPSHWIAMASLIASYYNTTDGFVILHGSDTMSYTASGLSFILEHLSKPVILTGSQLPIGDLRTDAKENLLTSIQLASMQSNGLPLIKEVCLYFEYKLYRGNRTVKLNAERFQAFNSPNYPCLAESGVHLKLHEAHFWQDNTKKPLNVQKELDTNIVLVKLYPGITEAYFNAILNLQNLKAVVLETFGSGNCTTEAWFVNILTALIAKKVHIINVTQCLGGEVQMGHYDTSIHLEKLGVISGKDITTSAALAKIMYLLGKKTPHKLLKTHYEMPLRGEMR